MGAPRTAVLQALPLAAAILELEREQAQVPLAPPDIVTWAATTARILDPQAGLQPFPPYPYQRAILADRSARRIILKARQTGISLTMAVEALYKAVYLPHRMILFISRTQDLAQQLIAYCEHALTGLTPAPRLEPESRSELGFPNGSRILSLPANPATGRGFPATDLYLDEFAWCRYDQQIYDGAVPAVAPGGQVTVLSTPNGRGNLYFRLWHGLEGGDWSRHRVHWSDCPRYDAAWAAQQQASMTREAFAQEFDCDFVASGAAVFDPADLARAQQGWDPTPAGCARYVTAWDIGRRQDWSVGLTLGLRDTTWHVVAFERCRDPYPVLQARIEARAQQFPGVHWVESNGVGDPVIENLTVRVQPFVTTAKTKKQAIDALQLLLQQDAFKHGEPQLDRELSLYEWSDEHLIQDAVMAAAIAAHGTKPLPRWGAV